MIFRKAELNDKDELIQLIKLADNRTEEAASRKVRKFIDSEKGFFILAVEKKKIVGYLLFMVQEEDENASRFLNLGDYSCVCWIAVHPVFRKKSIGTKLLSESEKFAKKENKKGLWLDCRENVLEFYEKNGFRNVGVYQKESRPCYVMMK